MARNLPEEEDLQSVARGWVATLVSGQVEEATLAGFKAWQARSPAHAEAFDQARGLYVQAPQAAPIEAAFVSERASGRLRRRSIVGGALAASLAMAMLVAGPDALFPPDYAAADGPARQFALADGSRILLDGGSSVDVDLGSSRRDIRLLRGRAWFEVAPDRNRPFVVSAHGGTATAVGTAYSVDATEEGVIRVDVTHGVVRVEAEQGERLLKQGEAARWGGAGLARVAMDPGRLAWRDGRLVIRDRRLGDAAALLDHYVPGRIVVLGSLANVRVGGAFATDRAEQGLEALARSQGARVRSFAGLVVVSAW